LLYNGDGCVGNPARFLLEEARNRALLRFREPAETLPIDSRYKFANLVFRKGAPTEGFDAAFMRHDPAELDDEGPKPWMVPVTRDEIRRLSPETLAIP